MTFGGRVSLKGLFCCSIVKTNSCFRYEGKTGGGGNLVSFKDAPMNNHINRELPKKPFH